MGRYVEVISLNYLFYGRSWLFRFDFGWGSFVGLFFWRFGVYDFDFYRWFYVVCLGDSD